MQTGYADGFGAAILAVSSISFVCKIICDVGDMILKKGGKYIDGFWNILLAPFHILNWLLRTPLIFLPFSLACLKSFTEYFSSNAPIIIEFILIKTICYFFGLLIVIFCYICIINTDSKIMEILTNEANYLVIDKEEFDNHKCLIKILKHLSSKYVVHLPDLESESIKQEPLDQKFKELEKAEKEIARAVDYCINEYIEECGLKKEKLNNADDKISKQC